MAEGNALPGRIVSFGREMKRTRIGGGGVGRREIAVGSTAEWPNTASVSEMHCMQDGHVGKRNQKQSAAEM